MKTEADIRKQLDAILARIDATEAVVNYGYRHEHATRFGENAITQNMGGAKESLSLSVTFGTRHGSASTTNLTADGIDRVVTAAVENAKLSPEDSEYVPLPGPQVYPETAPRYFEETAALSPDVIAGDVAVASTAAKKLGFNSSGLFCKSHGCSASANSKGLFAYDKYSNVDYSLTVHGPKGSGAESIANESYVKIDVEALVQRAVETAKTAQNPQDVEPDDMTVIFEPRAVRDLISYMFWCMSARSADEGTSAFAGRLGQSVAAPTVTIETRIDDPDVPASPYGDSGLAAKPNIWIENGILKQLSYDRYWAQEKGCEPTPNMGPFFMSGEDRSLDDLVASCKNGVLVKRLWYIRMVDSKELLLTGMTRDGFFKVENGKIVAPLKNLRFNESPLVFLQNIEAMSRPERVDNGYSLPGIISRDFTFSSKTESL